MKILETFFHFLDKDLFSTEKEVSLMIEVTELKEKLHQTELKLGIYERESKTFTFMPKLRGRRFDKIVAPMTLTEQEYHQYLYTELVPCLHKDGKLCFDKWRIS